MDPLSDVLSLLKPRHYMSAALDAGGDWCIQFDRHSGIKFNAVISGGCWLAVEGAGEPVYLEAGDCFLLASGRPFRMGSDLAGEPKDAATVFGPAKCTGIAVCNGGGDFLVIGSRFVLTGKNAGILMGVLPPIVHIRKESDQAALRWSLERMIEEQRDRQPGGHLVAEHLAHMMLVQALRLHLAEDKDAVGWLFALADNQIGAAISSIHEDPGHRWTLQEMADRAAMSRSAFALKFKEKVGKTPMEYLTRWRMLVAGVRLSNSGESISEIALSLGYDSESAFSTAFKRVMGCSPRQYSLREDLDYPVAPYPPNSYSNGVREDNSVTFTRSSQ